MPGRPARSFDELVMQPLRAFIGDAAQLLVSPDGALNLVPMEALIDEQGRYLLQRYSIGYLTSGRDLLRMQVARKSKSQPLVIANPFFGEPLTAQASTGGGKAGLPSRAEKRRSITTGEDLSSVYFAPLSGAAQEAGAIKDRFPAATVLTGRQATKAALFQPDAPEILHIATHVFFLNDAAGRAAQIENPLLRSGLALAGANLNQGGQSGGQGGKNGNQAGRNDTRGGKSDGQGGKSDSQAAKNDNQSAKNDGILTALEASGMNLWGAKLVTLSACDTGVGEVKDGEGVYGLRRAFVLAGAETLVMTLWPVSDYVTREVMTSYYTGLKQGLGRGEALRQAQLALLKRQGRSHPFYWAGFIQSGDWKNLNGK